MGDTLKIIRIKPLYIPEDMRGVTEIYYPVWLYDFRYTVKRKLFGDIKGRLIVLVDGINGRAYLADVYPELEEIQSKGKILNPEINEEESKTFAKEKAEAFLFRKFAYLKFSYFLSSGAFAYKLFWAKKRGHSYHLMDSITGDEIEIQKINE